MECEEWDVLCAVEHKDDCNPRLILYSKGYTLCYDGNVMGIILGLRCL